jgi:hypothetical protein
MKASFSVRAIAASSREHHIYTEQGGYAGRSKMGRKTTLIGFALFGFVLGFLAWLLRNPVADLISSLGVNQDILGAILAGIAGGFLMVVAVLIWSAVD